MIVNMQEIQKNFLKSKKTLLILITDLIIARFQDRRLSYKSQLLSFSSIKLLNPVRLFATLWIAARQASLSVTNSQSLLRLLSIELVMLSNHLIFCCPLFLPPSIFPSISVFSNESVLHIRQPKYLSFSFSISPSNKYSGMISLRMDWLDLLAVQGTLKSLLQHHSSKASILQYSDFFIVLTLTSIHDYRKNHSFDQMDLYWQSNVSAFF